MWQCHYFLFQQETHQNWGKKCSSKGFMWCLKQPRFMNGYWTCLLSVLHSKYVFHQNLEPIHYSLLYAPSTPSSPGCTVAPQPTAKNIPKLGSLDPLHGKHMKNRHLIFPTCAHMAPTGWAIRLIYFQNELQDKWWDPFDYNMSGISRGFRQHCTRWDAVFCRQQGLGRNRFAVDGALLVT